MAARVTAADPGPGRHLLDKTGAREQALTREAGQAQARTGELTARLRELQGAIGDLQVTRKTLISLAGQDDGQPSAEPAGPSPALPGHPAYQQILDAFADLRRPPRARDLCAALDLPIAPKNTENIRSKPARERLTADLHALAIPHLDRRHQDRGAQRLDHLHIERSVAVPGRSGSRTVGRLHAD